eukprot:gene26492-17577_t
MAASHDTGARQSPGVPDAHGHPASLRPSSHDTGARQSPGVPDAHGHPASLRPSSHDTGARQSPGVPDAHGHGHPASLRPSSHDTGARQSKVVPDAQVMVILPFFGTYHMITGGSSAQGLLVVVDEAQDINPLYWKIIVMIARLCHRPPQFLFIGDPRQSIYEYKGASPRFLAECDSLLPSEISGVRGWRQHTLQTTWRLTAPMVRFVNEVFLKGEDVLVAGHVPSSTTLCPRFMCCNVFDVSPTSVVFDLLTRYRPDQIMVLSPSVKKGRGKSPLRILEKRLLDRNVPLSVNDVFEECSLNEQQTLQGCPPASASKKEVTPDDTNDDADIRPNERGVCSLLEHLPFQTIKRASAHLTWRVQDIGVRAPALSSTVRTRGALAEYVADLNGIAIPAILEYRVTGRSQLLDMLPTLNMSSSKYCGNLRDALVSRISSGCDPSVSDFLCAATLHQSSASQYFYRAKQITRFDWLDEVDVESSLEVMRGAGICGGVVTRFEVPLRREFVPKACHVYGEADVVTEDSLYELKCTSGEVQLVHILQTALYAWMHGDDRKRIRLVYLLSGTVCDIDYDIASFERASGVSFDASEILVRFLKYIFEGLMVAVAAYFIPNTKLPPKDLMMISLVGAATFAVLDLFAPAVGSSVRSGAGFGIGANLVGFPGGER